MGQKTSYLHGIDLLRFGAALMVMFYHLGYAVWATETSRVALWGNAYQLHSLASVSWFGWAGVNVFFVISGYVIANSADGASAGTFVRSRVLRLYPALWICTPITLAVLVAVAYKHPLKLLKETVASLALWPLGPWLEGVYWTLGVEIVFYALVFAMLLTGIWRFAQWLGIGLIAWSTAYLAILTLDNAGVIAADWALRFSEGNYRLLLLEYGCCFGLGLLLARLSKGRLNWAGGLSIAVAGLAGSMQIYCQTLDLNGRGESSTVDLPSMWLVPAILWLVCCFGIWASAHWREHISRQLGRVTPITYSLGQMTYPLYLIHFSVGLVSMRLIVMAGVPPLLSLIIVMAGLIAFSFVVSAWLEPRLRSALAKIIGLVTEKLPFKELSERDA